MKLDLGKELLGLDGKPVMDGDKPLLMSKFVAGLLAAGQTDDAVKFMDWALKLYNEGSIEIDESDKEKLLAFLNENKTMTNLAKGAIMKTVKAAA